MKKHIHPQLSITVARFATVPRPPEQEPLHHTDTTYCRIEYGSTCRTAYAVQMPLYNENLEADLAPWRRRGRAAVSLSALVAWSARLPFRPTLRLVVLRGGRLGVAGQDGRLAPECRAPCDPLMQRVLAGGRVAGGPSAVRAAVVRARCTVVREEGSGGGVGVGGVLEGAGTNERCG